MLYVAKLGPIPFEEGEASLYLPLTEEGPGEPAVEKDDEAGLAAIARAHPGEEIVCEPALSSAGRAHGFQPSELPDWARVMLAELAARIALVPAGEGLDEVPSLMELLGASARLFGATPWRWWDAESTLEVAIRSGGEAPRRQEACLLGADGVELGLVLFDRPGGVGRFGARVGDGELPRAERVDFSASIFSDEPAFACRVLERTMELPLLPVPHRVAGGQGRFPEGEELAVLAAVARAVAQLGPSCRQAAAELGDGGREIRVTVKAPEPTVRWAEA